MTARFYPYEVLKRPGVLTVSRVTVDGSRPERDVQAQAGSVDLSQLPPWRRAVVRLQAELPSEDLPRLAHEIRVVVALHCGPTNLRTAAELHPAGAGRWQGELALDRALLAGRAELSVVVAGRTGGVPDRYIGRTNTVQIYLETPRRPLPNNLLPVRWFDFTREDAPVPTEFRDQPHYVDVTADPPVIWLNSSVPGLRNLLGDSDQLHKEAQAMRSMYLNAIATSGWLSLFNASVAGITEEADGEEPGMPPVLWQEQVLEILLPTIYPDLTLTAAVGRAAEDVQDPTMNRLLQARAQAAIGQRLRTINTVRSGIQKLQVEPADILEEEVA